MADYRQWNRNPRHWQGRQKPLARAMRKSPTEVEQVLWLALRGQKLNGMRFRRQHPVGPYIVDFFCAAAQLAVELDGGIHERPEQAAYDANRAFALGRAGINLLRFTNADVLERLDWVLDRILESAGAH
jgi:very-short-patch-repair endonuclease